MTKYYSVEEMVAVIIGRYGDAFAWKKSLGSEYLTRMPDETTAAVQWVGSLGYADTVFENYHDNGKKEVFWKPTRYGFVQETRN